MFWISLSILLLCFSFPSNIFQDLSKRSFHSKPCWLRQKSVSTLREYSFIAAHLFAPTRKNPQKRLCKCVSILQIFLFSRQVPNFHILTCRKPAPISKPIQQIPICDPKEPKRSHLGIILEAELLNLAQPSAPPQQLGPFTAALIHGASDT